jgi:hypothetical protein
MTFSCGEPARLPGNEHECGTHHYRDADRAWQLSSGTQGGVEIILRGTDSQARAALTGLRASKALVAWQRDGTRYGASVTLTTADGARQIRARTAILHEPVAALYDRLPLVRLDDAARRFWRRVFWLVRIPGGRRLLGLVARRSRGAR